jgi:hypothetical protein
MYEALVHEILKRRQSEIPQGMVMTENLEILRDVKANTLETLAAAYTNLDDDKDLTTVIMKIFGGLKASGSDMAEYWLSFLDMVDILMMNIHALHCCNWNSSCHPCMPCSHIQRQVWQMAT